MRGVQASAEGICGYGDSTHSSYLNACDLRGWWGGRDGRNGYSRQQSAELLMSVPVEALPVSA